jgi:hypothetical protein
MTLREALRSLYEEHGGVTPRLYVEVARDGDGPVAQRLRESLPWDADVALEKYQLLIAAKYIRTFQIAYKPTPRSSLRMTREFVSISSPEGRAYHPTEVVAQDPFMTKLALQDAERDWRNLKAKYANLGGFIEMVRRDLELPEVEDKVA